MKATGRETGGGVLAGTRSGGPLSGRRDYFALHVRLYWQDDTGTLHDGPGSIKWVSPDGLTVEVETGLGVSRLVTVRTSSGSSLQCVVRRRQESTRRILVELEVLPTVDGRSHLLALSQLRDVFEFVAGRQTPVPTNAAVGRSLKRAGLQNPARDA